MTIIITSLINFTFLFAENNTDILNLPVHILTWEMWWRISCLPCTIKLFVHASIWVILRKPSSVAHICKFVRVLQPQGTCLWQTAGATLTLSFALPRQITMSRIITDGGHQHSMQSEVLIDDNIPNLHTFPKELKIFDEGWRNTSILSPGCFGPETNIDSITYLRLLQSHGGDSWLTIEHATCYVMYSCFHMDSFHPCSEQTWYS